MENWAVQRLHEGLVVPAHPLALTDEGVFDEVHQRALTRYYHASGVGGIAVGVHTTQFAIRRPMYNLYKPVLELAAETIDACDAATGRKTVCIAGIAGNTLEATREAEYALGLGYQAGLLSLTAFRKRSEAEMYFHVKEVARKLPIIGFYLQPAVGGTYLSEQFWKSVAEIEGVVGIKVAPFDRYKTLDVVKGVAASSRASEIALYTGNDDAILADLLTRYRIPYQGKVTEIDIKGGILGHWACWTSRAVQHFEQCKAWKAEGHIPLEALTLAAEITDANAALFDVLNDFEGCIAGIHYVLKKQGLMQSMRCLNPNENLSHGQREAIEQVMKRYPHLIDDEFVAAHLDEWKR